MGKLDASPSAHFTQDVQTLLERPLGLSLPAAVLEAAVRHAFAAGLSAPEAAILISHEHSRRVSRQLVEQDRRASEVGEFAIASRIDESAGLAHEMSEDLFDLLPDLCDFVRQPCFSDEFRDLVCCLTARHGIPEHRWSAPEAQATVLRRASV